jgi:hypothetical protein
MALTQSALTRAGEAHLLSSGSAKWCSLIKEPDACRLLVLPNQRIASLPNAITVGAHQDPDAIVLLETNAAMLIGEQLDEGRAAILPVLDVSSERPRAGDLNGLRCDVHIDRATEMRLSDGLRMLQPMVERFRQLPIRADRLSDPRIRLLARLMVRGASLEPMRNPNTKSTFLYRDEFAIPSIVQHAESLVEHGLLDREFRDTVLLCPGCESSRISARERCSACGSTHLWEQPILHHFRCAHQAPEQEFRRRDGLICPKCRAALEYFSVDYDRPGMISVCRGCGHVSGQGSVGFLCLDCGLDTDERAIGSRVINAYGLTRAAFDFVATGADLTLDLRQPSPMTRAREFVLSHVNGGRPCCVLSIGLQSVTGRTRFLEHSCALLLQLIRETFTPETEILQDGPRFLALLANDRKHEVERALPAIQQSWERHLTWPDGLSCTVYEEDEALRDLAQ